MCLRQVERSPFQFSQSPIDLGVKCRRIAPACTEAVAQIEEPFECARCGLVSLAITCGCQRGDCANQLADQVTRLAGVAADTDRHAFKGDRLRAHISRDAHRPIGDLADSCGAHLEQVVRLVAELADAVIAKRIGNLQLLRDERVDAHQNVLEKFAVHCVSTMSASPIPKP